MPISNTDPVVPPGMPIPKGQAAADCVEHRSQAITVCGEEPDGTFVVCPAYVRYAPPVKLTALPGTPHQSDTYDTPAGLLTVYPAVEYPGNENTGDGRGLTVEDGVTDMVVDGVLVWELDGAPH